MTRWTERRRGARLPVVVVALVLGFAAPEAEGTVCNMPTVHKKCIQHDGLERCWFTHTPTAASNSTAPVPLVVELHGVTSCAEVLQYYTSFKDVADEQGFMIAWPQATGGPDTDTSWNCGLCCQPAMRAGIDDHGFLDKVIEDIESEHNVDPTRVYMAGHSNGCCMAQYMAAKSSHKVAAVACHSFYLLADAAPSYAAVPMMEIHGTADPTVSYSDFYGYGAVSNREKWKSLNACPEPLMIETMAEYELSSYIGCARNTEVVLVTLPGVNHQPYPGRNTSVPTTQMAWDFLKRWKSGGSSANMTWYGEGIGDTGGDGGESGEVKASTGVSAGSGGGESGGVSASTGVSATAQSDSTGGSGGGESGGVSASTGVSATAQSDSTSGNGQATGTYMASMSSAVAVVLAATWWGLSL